MHNLFNKTFYNPKMQKLHIGKQSSFVRLLHNKCSKKNEIDDKSIWESSHDKDEKQRLTPPPAASQMFT